MLKLYVNNATGSRTGFAPFESRVSRGRPRPVTSATRGQLHSPDSVEKRRPILGLLAACIEMDARVRTFETFAGRSAMVGFVVAVFCELVTEQGLFHAVTLDDMKAMGAFSLTVITLSAVLATMSKRRLGNRLTEAVISSLTAAKRSAGSVTQKQVDKAVDYFFEKVFNMSMVYSLLMEDNEFI